MFVNDLVKYGKINRNSKQFKKTTIGNNVTIGANSTILPVKISNNIVVGAGSVVTKNLSIKGIYVGNPAELIRRL
jgi:acetyltransferase-like isoleucine patch superfamily enzyme